MKKCDLMFCCLGNGVTVCNRAVMEHGDYKNIAHISDAGNIHWYIDPAKIDGAALLSIEHQADAMGANYWERFSHYTELQQYGFLLDRAPIDILLSVERSWPLCEAIDFLKKSLCKIL